MGKNLKNLKTLSPKEARELGSKGGKASVKARAKKRKLKEIAQMFLNCKAPEKQKKKIIKKFPELKDMDLTAGDLAIYEQLAKAVKGDSKAFEVVRDTAGEKPSDKIDLPSFDSHDINITFTRSKNKK